jgi:hypothetical protein
MSYVLITMFFLALYHFLYQGAIAPTLRDDLRNKLFVLRDELRALRNRHEDNCPDKVFTLLDMSIGRFLGRLPVCTVGLALRAAREYKTNRSFRESVAATEAIIDRCGSDDAKRIYTEITSIIGNVLLVNSGGWLPYLFLVAPVAIVARSIGRAVKLSKPLLWMPDGPPSARPMSSAA